MGGIPLHELDIQVSVYSKKMQTCDMFHGITLENIAYLLYPMPTNVRKIYINFWKSLEISGEFPKTRKYFKTVFKEFVQFLKAFEKFLEIFGTF